MSLNRRKFLREFGSAGVGALLVKGFAPAQEVGAACDGRNQKRLNIIKEV